MGLTACDSMEEANDANWRSGFVKSCVESAVQSGAPENIVEPICECSADKILEEHGPMVNMPGPLMDKVLDQCISEVAPTE